MTDVLEDLVSKFGEHAKEVTTGFAKTAEKTRELDARVLEIEQKSRRGYDYSAGALEFLAGGASESWGAQVARSDALRGVSANWKGTARIEVKATLTSLTTDAAGSSGALLAPMRPGTIDLLRRALRLRQLFMPGRTSAAAVEWPRQKTRTNNAAPQTAEGATKGQSDLQFDLVQWPVRTIAHFMIASKQILDDVPALQSIIDSELLYGLAVVEDDQLLNGGGTGTDLTGVYTNATAFSAPFVSDGNATMIDVLLQAIAQVDATDLEADGIVLNPVDWRKIQSLKDDDGNYLSAGPFSPDDVARLWSLPIAASKAMTAGNFLAGPFMHGAQIFDRQEATVEISTEDSDNFRRNLVTLRGEERLAFVVKYPAAFVKGNFETSLAAS